MEDIKKTEETYIGVEYIHTLMLNNDEERNLYLGMNVYNSKKEIHEELVLIIRPEDHEYLLNYLLEKQNKK